MKVLFTTDGSACSHHAIAEALRLLPLAGAEVGLLAVTPPPLVGADPMVGYGIADGLADSIQLEQEMKATHRHLAVARKMLESAGLVAQEMEREGDPAGAILDAAGAYSPDLLVLGSHGRNPVARFFIGSVSDAVVHHWDGAVLVVPYKEP